MRGPAWLILLSALTRLVIVSAPAQPPNILFVYTDDHAAWATGWEHPQAHTPHLDRLSREGGRLTEAFVTTPVCSPSRATLLTGHYAGTLGIRDWIHPSEDETGLDPEVTTWVELLSEAGYTTALVGKWHLGHTDRFHPTRFGYDEFMGFREGGRPPVDPSLEINGDEKEVEGLTVDILADQVIDFIRRQNGAPFMVSWHTRAPHRRWLPVADEDWAPYREMDPVIPDPDYPGLDVDRVKRETKEYLASVTGVDRNLGRVLATLRELDLREETVVIFTGNEGYNLGHNGFWGKGNGVFMLEPPLPDTATIPGNRRPNLLDHSLRVPTVIRWPGVIKPGTVVDETVTNLDWYPTMAAIAGLDLPDDFSGEGRNFLPLLRGEDPGDWENSLYAEYSPHHGIEAHMRMWRTERWKLIRDFLNPWRDELYDLENDPNETENLIHDGRFEIQLVRQALTERIIDKMRELDDPALELLESADPP